MDMLQIIMLVYKIFPLINVQILCTRIIITNNQNVKLLYIIIIYPIISRNQLATGECLISNY